MTIPSTSRKAGPLLGTGAQTAWPFTFKVFAASDIAVTIADSLGIETALVLDTDYSVALNANQETSPGGTVTYPISGSPLAVGSKLSIIGDLDYDQPLDLPSGGNFSPLALENQLDRLTMQIQQLKEQVSRSLQVSVTTNADAALPAPAPNELIGWDSTGDNLANYALSELATGIAYGTMRFDTFVGDGTTTQFALTEDPAALANLDVSLAGVTQVPGTDYTLTSATLVFTTAPANGVAILARYGRALPISGPVDSSAVTYTPAGTGAVATTVQAKLRESVSVLDFGADPTGVADSTSAIQAAIDAHNSVHIPAGTYRCDNSIIIQSTGANRKSVTMTGATKLRRLSAYSSSTGPVIELIGDYGHFDGGMGLLESQNNSPRGVVALGHRDTNTLTLANGLFWSFANCDVRCKNYVVAPTESTVVGVYIPSAQPNKGSNYANYYGTVSNVRVFDSGTAFWLTDQANAHTFVNCTVEFFWHYAWRFNGAYGNTVYGGFINGCYQNAGVAMYLANRIAPAAAYAASHQSIKNSIFGITVELYTTGNYGVYIDAAAGGLESGGNFIQFNWNSLGTSVLDGTTAKTNTIFDGASAFRLGYNLRIPDSTLNNVNLLQVGKTSTANHTIARTATSGTTVLSVENLSTVEATVYALDVVWNTPSIGYSSGHIIGTYHAPTSAYRFKVMDTGNCQNTNNSYGAISDAKLKNIIGACASQWGDVKFLASKLTKYTLKDDPEKLVQLGWIAQEIEGTCPGLVFETPDTRREETIDKDGNSVVQQVPTGETTKGVQYSIANLKAFKALGEALDRIEKLEARLSTLEAI